MTQAAKQKTGFLMVLDLLVDRQGRAHICEIQDFDNSGLSGFERVTMKGNAHEALLSAMKSRVQDIDEKWKDGAYTIRSLELLQRCFRDKAAASVLMRDLRVRNAEGEEDVFLIDGQNPAALAAAIVDRLGTQKAYVLKKPTAAVGEGVFIVPAQDLENLISVLQFASHVDAAQKNPSKWQKAFVAFMRAAKDPRNEDSDLEYIKTFQYLNPRLYKTFKRLKAKGYISNSQLAHWTVHEKKGISPLAECVFNAQPLKEQPAAIVVQPFCDDVEPVSVRECFKDAKVEDRLEKILNPGDDREPGYDPETDLDAKRKPTMRLVVEVHLEDGALLGVMPVAAYEKMSIGDRKSLDRKDIISKAEVSAPVSYQKMTATMDALRLQLKKALSRVIAQEDDPVAAVLSLLKTGRAVEAVVAMDIAEHYLRNGHYHNAASFNESRRELTTAILDRYAGFLPAQKSYARRILDKTYHNSYDIPREAGWSRRIFPVVLGMARSPAADENLLGIQMLEDLLVNHDIYDEKLEENQVVAAFAFARDNFQAHVLRTKNDLLGGRSQSLFCRAVDALEDPEPVLKDEDILFCLPLLGRMIAENPMQERAADRIRDVAAKRGLVTQAELDDRYNFTGAKTLRRQTEKQRVFHDDFMKESRGFKQEYLPLEDMDHAGMPAAPAPV